MKTAKVKQLIIETPEGHSGSLTKEARYVFNYETTSRDAELSLVMPLRAQSYGLEDMAVLMGKSPSEKYNGSLENIAKAVDLFCGSNSVESKARLFEYIALSIALRNGDAHLKNFSLIYDTPHGDVKLSPLYDVVTTMIYTIEHPRTGATKVDNTMALNMFKTKNYPLTQSLITFGRSVCMVKNPERIIDRIEEAKYNTLADYQSRIDPWLYRNLKSVWGSGGVTD